MIWYTGAASGSRGRETGGCNQVGEGAVELLYGFLLRLLLIGGAVESSVPHSPSSLFVDLITHPPSTPGGSTQAQRHYRTRPRAPGGGGKRTPPPRGAAPLLGTGAEGAGATVATGGNGAAAGAAGFDAGAAGLAASAIAGLVSASFSVIKRASVMNLTMRPYWAPKSLALCHSRKTLEPTSQSS